MVGAFNLGLLNGRRKIDVIQVYELIIYFRNILMQRRHLKLHKTRYSVRISVIIATTIKMT